MSNGRGSTVGHPGGGIMKVKDNDFNERREGGREGRRGDLPE